MEENNVVEMKPQAEVPAEQKKLSYEELSQIAHQLSEQTRKLYAELQKANMTNIFRRLDYLFKVVENADKFSSEFLLSCVEEIEKTITLPEASEEVNEEVNEG